MKKLIIALSTCAAALAAPQAFAQSTHFKGLSAGFGFNLADSMTEKTASGFSNSGVNTDINGFLQLQYNIALDEKFVLGVGGTIGIGDLKAGSVGMSQYKDKDSYSVYVAPGYAIDSRWLGYGKVAYLSTKSITERGNSVNFDGGFGYGLGVQMMINKHWYGQAEYMHNRYGESDTLFGNRIKLQSDVLSIAAGYKF